MSEIRVGSWVGASRWPNQADHPSQWSRPFGGQLMDINSTIAWANTPEFPTAHPDGAAVMNHVIEQRRQGKLEDVVPVMWDFGGNRIVKWEKASTLRSFGDDIKLWNATRAMRLDELAHPRRRTPRQLVEFLPQALQHLASA